MSSNTTEQQVSFAHDVRTSNPGICLFACRINDFNSLLRMQQRASVVLFGPQHALLRTKVLDFRRYAGMGIMGKTAQLCRCLSRAGTRKPFLNPDSDSRVTPAFGPEPLGNPTSLRSSCERLRDGCGSIVRRHARIFGRLQGKAESPGRETRQLPSVPYCLKFGADPASCRGKS